MSKPRQGQNNPLLVIPAQAGIQFFQRIAEELDPSLRWDDSLFGGSLDDPACAGISGQLRSLTDRAQIQTAQVGFFVVATAPMIDEARLAAAFGVG